MGDAIQLPPRHYFVTGATGALGSMLVCTLLKQPNARVTLLMRNSDPNSTQVQELLSFFKLGGVQNFGAIRLVQGDITKERLGLSREIEHQVLEEVTHIVHSAASVDMNLREKRHLQQPLKALAGLFHFCAEPLGVASSITSAL